MGETPSVSARLLFAAAVSLEVHASIDPPIVSCSVCGSPMAEVEIGDAVGGSDGSSVALGGSLPAIASTSKLLDCAVGPFSPPDDVPCVPVGGLAFALVAEELPTLDIPTSAAEASSPILPPLLAPEAEVSAAVEVSSPAVAMPETSLPLPSAELAPMSGAEAVLTPRSVPAAGVVASAVSSAVVAPSTVVSPAEAAEVVPTAIVAPAAAVETELAVSSSAAAVATPVAEVLAAAVMAPVADVVAAVVMALAIVPPLAVVPPVVVAAVVMALAIVPPLTVVPPVAVVAPRAVVPATLTARAVDRGEGAKVGARLGDPDGAFVFKSDGAKDGTPDGAKLGVPADTALGATEGGNVVGAVESGSVVGAGSGGGGGGGPEGVGLGFAGVSTGAILVDGSEGDGLGLTAVSTGATLVVNPLPDSVKPLPDMKPLPSPA